MRDKKDLPSMQADEAAVVNYGREFFQTHKVSDSAFQAAQQEFGVHGLSYPASPNVLFNRSRGL